MQALLDHLKLFRNLLILDQVFESMLNRNNLFDNEINRKTKGFFKKRLALLLLNEYLAN